MSTPIQSPAKIEAFPESRIRESLTAWWNEEVEKRRSDPFAPKTTKGTLYEVLPSIDSLAVLESMIIIEQIIDQKVPARFIKPGGYDSSEDMLKHLIPQMRKLYETQNRR